MPSRNEKPSELSAIRIYRGVSIYKVRGSQYWYVRVWDRERKRYVVKGTGETSVIRAREVAKDHALSLLKAEEPVERQFTFHHFAIKCLSKSESLAAKGERNIGYVKAIKWSLQNSDWGLLKWFDSKDVRKITTRDFTQYMDHLTTKRPDLTASTKNTIMDHSETCSKWHATKAQLMSFPTRRAQNSAIILAPSFDFIRSFLEKMMLIRRCSTLPSRWRVKG